MNLYLQYCQDLGIISVPKVLRFRYSLVHSDEKYVFEVERDNLPCLALLHIIELRHKIKGLLEKVMNNITQSNEINFLTTVLLKTYKNLMHH